MGTIMSQMLHGRQADSALRAAARELRQIESLLSRFRPDSEISRINRQAGAGDVRLSPVACHAITLAAEEARRYSGFFDVTVGPLVCLWQRCRLEHRSPWPAEIDVALALVGHADLTIDRATRSVGLRRRGQSIDLGGFGKGYAGDRLLDLYLAHGVRSALVNLGGHVLAVGTKPDRSPWRVGISHPRCEGRLLGLVAVADRAVVTSGDYQRFFVDRAGHRWHHIVNPRTGYPAESGLSSVTIIAASSTTADVLSTAVFVAGLARGLDLLRACPDIQAILVDTSDRVYLTAGLRGQFEAAPGIDVSVV
jgi:thiamine biosynthesis lipoprotein